MAVVRLLPGQKIDGLKSAAAPDEAGKIAGYENMSFEQRRAAQDAQSAQQQTRGPK